MRQQRHELLTSWLQSIQIFGTSTVVWFLGSVIQAMWTQYLCCYTLYWRERLYLLAHPVRMIFHNSLFSYQEGFLNFDSKLWWMSLLLNLDHQIYEKKNFYKHKTGLNFSGRHISEFVTSTVALTAKLVRLPICTDRCCYLEERHERSADADVHTTGFYCYKI